MVRLFCYNFLKAISKVFDDRAKNSPDLSYRNHFLDFFTNQDYLCMMRQLLIFQVFVFLPFFGLGQVRPQFSMFMLNKYYDNAAYGGLERSLHVVSIYRDQYNAILKNPRSFYIGADLPLYILNGGIGFNIQNSTAGVIDISTVKFSYNRVFANEIGLVSIGGRFGAEFINIDGSKIITPDGDYEASIIHNDPYLDNTSVNGIGAIWELGTYFYGKNIEAGFSLFDLPQHATNVGLGKVISYPSWSVMGQYKLKYSDIISFRTSFLVKSQRKTVQADLSIMGEWNQQTFGGVNVRGYDSNSLDAAGIFFGTNINAKTKLAYSYEFGLSALQSVHQGSHEFSVFYNLQQRIGIGLPPKISYNPRHL